MGTTSLKTTITGTISVEAGTTSAISNSVGVTLNDSSSAGNFIFSAGGSLNVNNVSTTNGSISLTATAGQLQILVGKTIDAVGGNLTIVNSNTTSGTILIGNGATLNASSATAGVGNVTIVVGSVPSKPIAGSLPGNVNPTITSGGNIFYGTKGINANAPTNNLTAEGRNIIFNDGNKTATKSITLDGGVNINAEPIGYSVKSEAEELIVDTGDDANESEEQLEFSLNQ